MQLIFGIGALWGTRTDVTGVGPDQFAVLQNNEIDFSFEVKELYSQLGFPIDIARGKGKISGKAKMARVFGALYADLFFGSPTTNSETTVSEDEVATLATNSYSVANASTFAADLGVFYNSGARLRFNYVTGAPSSGQYSVSVAGVYTFATADISQSIAVSYVYTLAGIGKSISITNNFMGYTPTFIGTFYQQR